MHPIFERRPKPHPTDRLARFRGTPVSLVDQPSTIATRAFATAVISAMILTTAILILT